MRYCVVFDYDGYSVSATYNNLKDIASKITHWANAYDLDPEQFWTHATLLKIPDVAEVEILDWNKVFMCSVRYTFEAIQ